MRRPLFPLACLSVVTSCIFGGLTLAEEPVTLTEEFKPGAAYRVEVEVKLSGDLAIPQGAGKPAKMMAMAGKSQIVYDERILTPDDAGTIKSVRIYRTVDFRRINGEITQEATVRPSVRRMVVIKSGARKGPFSPDGPLTWNEIDLVRTDVFSPAAIPGLLPPQPVIPGQKWRVTDAALAELTDLEKVDEGELTVEFVGVTTVVGSPTARLRLTGSVRGLNQDGPNRQKLEGIAFFDLTSRTVTYLSIKGSHELLDGASGQVFGRIEGQFKMTRTPSGKPAAELTDAALDGIGMKPTSENTLLLYDNPDLGVRFLHPRGWRVGTVQGRQVTLDHARLGAGMLITVEPPTRTPKVDDYVKEIGQFLAKEKAQIGTIDSPTRIRSEPVLLDRFGLDATIGPDNLRLEYAVLTQTDGGITLAARLPARDSAELRPETDRIIRSLAVTKRIEGK